jgi:NitT/TauT family transport system permease protein/taurine transport system permease protein
MTLLLKLWSLYARVTARFPALRSIVPFIPVVALWAVVAESGMFPRAFFPGPLEVLRSFGTLVYKGILPDYLACWWA